MCDRLDESNQALAEEAVGRASEIAERWARIFPEHEQDLESAAFFGAVRAASTYKPDLGGVWERWSSMCIQGEIQDFLGSSYVRRKSKKSVRALGILADTAVAAEEVYESDTLFSETITKTVSRKHWRLLELVYGEYNMNAEEAGIALGYSKGHGAKLHRQAIELLREILSGTGSKLLLA